MQLRRSRASKTGVSGDLNRRGHIDIIEEAATLGEVAVGLAADAHALVGRTRATTRLANGKAATRVC
jgi:hypothetical protein